MGLKRWCNSQIVWVPKEGLIKKDGEEEEEAEASELRIIIRPREHNIT